MALDPSIILAGGQINDPNSMLALQQQMQKITATDQSLRRSNALRGLLSNPQSYVNGQLTPQARQQAMGLDPETGIELQKQDYQQQALKFQQQLTQTEMGKKKFDLLTDLAGAGVNAYDEAKKAGRTEEEARSAGTQARNEAADTAYQTGSGIISDGEYKQVTSNPFDPLKSVALAGLNKDWAANRAKQATEHLGENRLAETERHNTETEKIAAQRADAADKKADALLAAVSDKPGVQETIKVKDKDGNVSEVQAFVKGPGKVVGIDGKPIDPESIVGAAKTGSAKPDKASFTPEMSGLMGALAEKGVSLPTGFRSKEQQIQLYQGLLDRNPGKSPDEIADLVKKGKIELGAQMKETQTAAGIAGKVQVFANELDKNLPLVREAAAAIPRGDWMDLTKLLQTGDEHLSDPKLKTLKGYINSTLQAYDGLSARGGTDVEKRALNRKLLTSADGPEAFAAQLKVFENEAKIAKDSAYEATKSPELSGAGPKVAAPQPFDTIDAAEKAAKSGKLKDGDKVIIGGRPATWHE